MKVTYSIVVLTFLAIALMFTLASCVPTPSAVMPSATGHNIDLNTRFFDCEAKVVCYAQYNVGMSCLPISQTALNYDKYCNNKE